jgi:hypothetical protein
LVLGLPGCGAILGSKGLASKELGDTWPRLKALHLGEGDQHWLDHLPTFRELQILSLRILESETANIRQNVENITRCRDLRVINFDLGRLDDVEILMDIARGCRLLQMFRVRPAGCRVGPEVANSLLSNLFRALPRLEYLAVCLEFQMDGAVLEDLARHCPQLTVLELPRTQLYASLSL